MIHDWDLSIAATVVEGDDLVCKCGDYLVLLETSYGWRAACRGCRIRWTLLHNEIRWTAETYSPMDDNCHKPEHTSDGVNGIRSWAGPKARET